MAACARIFSLFVALALMPAALAAERGADSGLPVPRFVSLGADRVNARTGPGTRYPVTWVFVRAALPVEVIGEFHQWRQVRDRDGAEGWVHKAMLSGRRTVMVTGGIATLRAAPRPEARALARVEPGVLGRLEGCRAGWCEVGIDDYTGWLPGGGLWGADTADIVP